MKVESRSVLSIRPYPNNPRQNDDAVAAVAESIREFGWQQPIVVDAEGVIIAGHTRFAAALSLGMTEVPVQVASDLTPAQVMAYRIADNKLGELAGWDKEKLRAELRELASLEVDLGMLGYSQDELQRLLGEGAQGVPAVDPDDIPEAPDEPITQPGDLWILGDHRLLCGDASKWSDVERLLDGEVIHLVNTDPPYNVKVEPRSNNAIAAGNSSFANPNRHHQKFDLERHPEKAKATHKKMRAKDRPLANDFVTDEAFDELLDAWFGNLSKALVPGRSFYIWGGYANCANYPPALVKHELYFSQAVIWVKEHPVMTRKDFMGNHEWCQPFDTSVLTPDGPVPIGSLRNGDRVVAYNRNWSQLLGSRKGHEVSVSRRAYDGILFCVSAVGKETHCTDGHLWTARLAPESSDMWCVYLMRRGPWWRVGKCKITGQHYGFGLKSRVRQEKAESAWILDVHYDASSAICAEQVASVKYGIPTTHWETSERMHLRGGIRSMDDIRSIYSRLDLLSMHEGALRALADHGRRIEFPIVDCSSGREKLGRRDPFTIRACNLIPKIMSIPVSVGGGRVDYAPIGNIESSRFSGEVFGLDVPIHRHYVADGLVTHNCFYGWKLGAGHTWLGPRNVLDVWLFSRAGAQVVHPVGDGVSLDGVDVLPSGAAPQVTGQELRSLAAVGDEAIGLQPGAGDVWFVKKLHSSKTVHLTEKPVELAARAMRYSSRKGENVLDFFGGSGSTLIAAEMLGRRAFLTEIDPAYCDVIVRRWEQFTGRKAEVVRG